MFHLLVLLFCQLSRLTSPITTSSQSLLPRDIATANVILKSITDFLVTANNSADIVNEVSRKNTCNKDSCCCEIYLVRKQTILYVWFDFRLNIPLLLNINTRVFIFQELDLIFKNCPACLNNAGILKFDKILTIWQNLW